MNAVENNNIALQVRYEHEQELRDKSYYLMAMKKKLTLILMLKIKRK